MRHRARIIGFLCAILLAARPSHAAVGEHLDRRHLVQTFSEEFAGPLSWCSEQCAGERWRTKFFHSGTTPMSRGLGQGGPGDDAETEVCVDPVYLHLGIDPFPVSSGILHLTVRPADAGTRAAVKAAWPADYHGPHLAPRFTAGLLTTERSFRQRFGYFEARIRVPAVVGAWPAFWMLGPAGTVDEIDVLEMLSGRPTRMHAGHHWRGTDGRKQDQYNGFDTIDLSKSFHTYGVLWTPRRIAYYRDDVELSEWKDPPLEHPMYLLVSMGMDGSWNRQEGFRARDDATAVMDVDWVRAWQFDVEPRLNDAASGPARPASP